MEAHDARNVLATSAQSPLSGVAGFLMDNALAPVVCQQVLTAFRVSGSRSRSRRAVQSELCMRERQALSVCATTLSRSSAETMAPA